MKKAVSPAPHIFFIAIINRNTSFSLSINKLLEEGVVKTTSMN